jgi:predicted polyphosphate/ATP-dependent NAD kinase
MFKLGLIINPYAGIGGPLALKGSDGESLIKEALQEGKADTQRALSRAATALSMIEEYQSEICVYGFSGAMAGDAALQQGFSFESLGCPQTAISTASDSIAVARQLQALKVDLILFVGGDGTARDLVAAVGVGIPVLGIPSGVKMHSGVYAVSPQAAGEILKRLLSGQLVDVALAEVRDIDEQAFREGKVKTRFYGELLVPREGQFLQHVKSSGREVEALVIQDIAADIIESMSPDVLYIIGPGSTTKGVMDELGLANTLLGIDAVCNRTLIASDLAEQEILRLLDEYGQAEIIITAIGGQGHILGRGNQQLSPAVLRRVGLDKITVIASKSKITELQGRPLLVDSNDPMLDQDMAGYRKVITGYHDAILYPVA